MVPAVTKGIAALAAVAAVLMAAGAEARAGNGSAPPGFVAAGPVRPAPDLPFTDAEGRQHRLSHYRGRVVLVMFWATWCPACLAELPSVDRLSARLGRDGLAVLAIAQQSGDARIVRRFLRRRGLTHLAALADHERRLGLAFAQRLFPTMVLLDRAGREVGRVVGPADWDSPALLALVRRCLAAGGAIPSSPDSKETTACRS